VRQVCFTRSALAAGFVVSAIAGGWASAQVGPETEAGRSSYVVDRAFFRLPEGRKIGSTAGIAIERDGRSIWVFDRCGASTCVGSALAPIMQFDGSGNLLKNFGAGLFVRPHGIYVDAEGNVWVTDGEGPDGKDPRRNGKGHQVFKFSPDGELLMTLGKAGVAGDGADELNQPSAVIVAPNGDIFVADGHGGNSNARIVKLSKDGAFIKTWGRKGTAPGEFDTPHALALDSRGRLFVGDRGNNRIQIFDQDGNFLDEWKQFGNPSGLYIDKKDMLYVTEIGANAEKGPDWKQGIRIGSVTDGKVTAFIDDSASGRSSQEGVTADAAGNIYTSLTAGMELRRYAKR
jgi:sugar lactone lactonase YvrE